MPVAERMSAAAVSTTGQSDNETQFRGARGQSKIYYFT